MVVSQTRFSGIYALYKYERYHSPLRGLMQHGRRLCELDVKGRLPRHDVVPGAHADKHGVGRMEPEGRRGDPGPDLQTDRRQGTAPTPFKKGSIYMLTRAIIATIYRYQG